MSELVHEVVVFKLNEGVDRAQFERDGAEVQRWVERQQGFLDRVLLADAGESGTWVDLVRWRSAEDAQAASEKFERELGASAFVTAIDPASLQFLHMEPVDLGERAKATA